jgi:hypothetical protein
VIEELRGARDESPYMQFHRCVYWTVGWLEGEREKGAVVTPDLAISHLNGLWSDKGPIGHPFEAYYRSAATAMVQSMAAAIATDTAQYDRAELIVSVGTGRVSVTPDRIVLRPGGAIHVQRIRTGRETKSESKKPIYALLRRGALSHFPGKRVVVETFYLVSGKTVEVPAGDDDKLLREYAAAITQIETGHFEPFPDARRCPRCQCYFVCGA